MDDAYALIAKIEFIIVGSGTVCLVLLVPFLSRRINTYVDGIVSKNTELVLLLTIAEHLSRSIEIEELRGLVVDIVRDTFDADSLDIVNPREGRDCRIYRWSRETGKLERARLQDSGASMAIIERWRRKDLETEETTADGKLMCLPIKKGEASMALLTIGRTTKPFEAKRLALTTAVSSFLSMAFENARLYSMAISDELTALYTTRHFRHCIDKEVSQSERYGQKTSLLMLDIDNFKRINDTLGHLAGDAVLKEVAQSIVQSIRDNDLAFRYGGEEFAVLLPSTELKGGVFVAERIRRAIEDHVVESGTDHVSVTVSVGVSTCPDHAGSVRDVILAADQALYAAKHAGKNRVVAAHPPATPDSARPAES
jgi:diguanylate cyclase (GGDEF)-like protein